MLLGIANEPIGAPVIESIVAQHAEEASFLWLLRDRADTAPHYALNDLAKLDGRVDAHLDGLRIAGEAGWEACMEALGAGESGEFFVASVLAFESGLDRRILEVLEAAEEMPETCRGLVSALGWLSWAQAEVHVSRLLADESQLQRCVGIAACAAHRRDPGRALTDALSDEHPLIMARALHAVGELGRKDLLPFLPHFMRREDEFCRYNAAWSATLLGDEDAADLLRSFVRPDFPWPEDALRVAMRCLPLQSALEWRASLACEPESRRAAVIGAGVIGDPVMVPWLIEQMGIPDLARVAGESFTMITGVDIAYADLEGERPEDYESGPTENPEDEDVDMDTDEDLPWPVPDLVGAWWKDNGGRFRSGTRYLLGQQIGYEHLEYVLRTGRQRQRQAAAVEMSMLKPGLPLFEVRAPGFRQKQLLGLH